MYCIWRGEDPHMINYHDNVFGYKKTNTKDLYKWLILEQAQAGLSWLTIIRREEAYDLYLKDYDINNIKNWDYEKELITMKNYNIIQNKLKLKAIINSAKIISEIEQDKSFYNYLKDMIDTSMDIDSNIHLIVKLMKKDGFKFIGYEIIKSFYESVGLINGHEENCSINLLLHN